MNSDKDHEISITTPKAANFSDWYRQVITKGKFGTYYDVSGCYVLLPNCYAIWENIQKFIDYEIKKIGVKNAAFPLFITERNLSKEQSHLEGFAAEVLWIQDKNAVNTTNQNTIEENKDQNRVAIRPTSECAMYPIFKNLIQSHTDLPLKLNQWCNVVRWETKETVFLIRSVEFYWSETHTCFATKDEAMIEIFESLDIYKRTYNDLLAVPVIKGRKTNNEKFAGAECTYTLEAYIPIAGKGIQACTSHCLGQNFSKMFDITFQDSKSNKQYVWQNSWGFTTRSIGIMLMNHGDDKGAIVPPYAAATQIVIIPIMFKGKEQIVSDACYKLLDCLKSRYRVELDMSNHRTGWKYNYWETQGVPLRIEIGPRDVTNNTMVFCRRTDATKQTVSNDDRLCDVIDLSFKEIHNDLYAKAHHNMMSNICCPADTDEFEAALNSKKLCYINWCETDDCENKIKQFNCAKPLCIPTDLGIILDDGVCCICQSVSREKVLFGRSY